MTAAVSAPPASVRPATIDRGLRKGSVTHKVYECTATDGTVTHVCAECGFSHTNLWSVVTHRRYAHPKPQKAQRPKASPVDRVEQAFTILRAAIDEDRTSAQVDALTAERDDWKRRAKDAERKLAAMRRALGVTE